MPELKKRLGMGGKKPKKGKPKEEVLAKGLDFNMLEDVVLCVNGANDEGGTVRNPQPPSQPI